jgi:hypothetical protein
VLFIVSERTTKADSWFLPSSLEQKRHIEELLLCMRFRVDLPNDHKPNKAPEPTTRSVTPRAFVLSSEMKQIAYPNAARVAPEPVKVVAHL